MSWIKLETHTFDKVEIYDIAHELNIDPDAVIGKCARIWAWFDVNTVDGVTKSVTKALLDRYCGVTGFCNAMINAGWMHDDGEMLQLPFYERHNSTTAKARALGSKRQLKFKSNGNSEKIVTSSVTLPLPKSSHREEKRREDIKTMSGKSDASEVLDYLNLKTGRTYQYVDANIKLIIGRLQTSSVNQCKAVIDIKVAKWKGDAKMDEFLRPKTLFNATNYAQYVGELGSVASGVEKIIDPEAWRQLPQFRGTK